MLVEGQALVCDVLVAVVVSPHNCSPAVFRLCGWHRACSLRLKESRLYVHYSCLPPRTTVAQSCPTPFHALQPQPRASPQPTNRKRHVLPRASFPHLPPRQAPFPAGYRPCVRAKARKILPPRATEGPTRALAPLKAQVTQRTTRESVSGKIVIGSACGFWAHSGFGSAGRT